jgi:superfamily II DNA/RNA helicase
VQKAAIMVRRLKKELPPDDLGRPRFPGRVLEALEVPYTDDERRAHQALQRYAELRLKGAAEGAEGYATEFVLKLLKKRLFSSPEAFRITVEKHARTMREGRGERSRKVPRRSVKLLRREIEAAEEENADDSLYEERALEVVGATTAVFRPPSEEEEGLLAELSRWATRASGRADSKAERLVTWLEEMLRSGNRWNDQRVIVFTEYRATQNWLEQILAARELTKAGRLLTLYGGMPTEDRERVKAAFQAGPEVSSVRILLATDAASEGIDLQNHCSRLVHYEIPWNPNRLEQRNGRIDRHGQKARDVRVFHFVAKGYAQSAAGSGTQPGKLEGDLEFLMRAALKVEQIRDDLGNAGDVIAQQVEEAMLGRRRRLDESAGSERTESARAALRTAVKIQEQLRKLVSRLHESRESLRISSDHLRAVVEIGLELAGHPPLVPVEVPGSEGMGAISAYELPPLGGTWAACAEGLAHPYTGAVRPMVFDHDVAAGRDDVVLAHMGHRLVQMCLRLLRAQMWAPEGQRKLHRVSARVVADSELEHPAVVAHARLVVLGKDGSRLHEQVLTAAGAIESGRFSRLNVTETQAVLGAVERSDRGAPTAVRKAVGDLWHEHSDKLLDALRARERERAKGLEKLLEERASREIKDVTHVLEELRKSIHLELDRKPPAQLELWSTPERDQRQRDHDALRARAEAVPAEIEQEERAIRERYAQPQARLFPVAVTYAIPARLARSAETERGAR